MPLAQRLCLRVHCEVVCIFLPDEGVHHRWLVVRRGLGDQTIELEHVARGALIHILYGVMYAPAPTRTERRFLCCESRKTNGYRLL